MSLRTVAGATPSIVVAVTHLPYCNAAGVPEFETLPPPAAVEALAWPGVVKSQVIEAVFVRTRSAVKVAFADEVIYSAFSGAPPVKPARAAWTNAVVAIEVSLSPGLGVGALGSPVKVGLAIKA